MTDTTTISAEQQTTFESLVARCGGLSAMSPVELELATLASALLVASRADPDVMAKNADTILRLLAQLPTPAANADDTPPEDLTKLSDSELETLAHLLAVARGQAPPEPIPPLVEREIGRNEQRGASLGAYIDANCERWRFGGPTELEQNELRNRLVEIGDGFVVRKLYSAILASEVQDLISDSVRKALAAVGSDAKLVPPTPAELEPPKPPAPPLNPLDQIGYPGTAGPGGVTDITPTWPFTSR